MLGMACLKLNAGYLLMLCTPHHAFQPLKVSAREHAGHVLC